VDFLNYEKKPAANTIEQVVNGIKSGAITDGSEIEVHGSIQRIKPMGEFAFVNVRSSRLVFQCILEESTAAVSISQFAPEDCVIIKGKVVFEERSKLGFDVKIEDMKKVGGAVAPLPVEISNDRKIANLQMNTLLDNRVVTLRNPKARAAIKLSEGVMYAFREFLRTEGFTEFVPPKLVQTGAEGGADMFEVDYFEKKAYLNQSPQMYKQIMVGVFERVYTVAPVFRGEKHSTNRHINEFQGLDLEMGFINSFEDIMEIEARLFKYMFEYLNSEYAHELDMLLGAGKRLPLLDKFPKVRFADVKQMYADAHGKKVTDPADLGPEEEKWIGEYFLKECGAPIVFVTHYPSKKRPFYAMDDPEDTRYTLSYDMLLYGMEVTTGGQRINDYNMQVEKMQKRGMDVEEFEDYLTMHKYGMPPHGGFGLGLERIVQKLAGFDNIRQATAFPRDRDRLRP
jgi:nondiscriminating aspartyl-tRNA synthetase